MIALRPIPFEACREALKWASEQTDWFDREVLVDVAAEKLTHFQASDEALEHTRACLWQALDRMPEGVR